MTLGEVTKDNLKLLPGFDEDGINFSKSYGSGTCLMALKN